jgi:trk system potassium uptake protein TrkH
MKLNTDKILTILYLIGGIFIVLGVLMLIPLVISLYLKEDRSLYLAYLIPTIIFLSSGILFSKINNNRVKFTLTNSMIVCSLGWFFSSLISAFPFWYVLDINYLDALFETVSGFTTTGITVFQNSQTMPVSIIFWRSFIQWLGGLGILTFFLVITFRSKGETWRLFSAESHKFETSRPVPNFSRSIKILWAVYIIFTLIQTILLNILGINFFDAITHSFTTISTGGFSRFDSSISYFSEIGHPNYILIEYVIIFFMLMGGINFLVHYKVLFKGKIKEYFIDEELKYFWKIIFYTLMIILIGYYINNNFIDLTHLEETFRKILFQVVSIITTTGFETEHIGSQFFPEISRQLFLMLMLIGGCVGSTAGGVKVIRIVILNKLFIKELNKFYLPKRAVFPVTINKNIISKEKIKKVAAIFYGWLLLILIGGAITVLFSHLNAFQSLSGMFSAVSNIGPFYFSVGEMQTMSPIIKITYIIGMLAGRLELIPVLLLFNQNTWK